MTDEPTLQGLIDLVLDAGEHLESEVLLYQRIVEQICAEQGLTPQMTQDLVEVSRKELGPKIAAALSPRFRSRREKAAGLVSLLRASRAELLELLKSWKTEGPAN